MIVIATLTPADEGRGVVYSPRDGGRAEDGVIASWNDKFIFVRYGASQTSAATDPQDLDWLGGGTPSKRSA